MISSHKLCTTIDIPFWYKWVIFFIFSSPLPPRGVCLLPSRRPNCVLRACTKSMRGWTLFLSFPVDKSILAFLSRTELSRQNYSVFVPHVAHTGNSGVDEKWDFLPVSRKQGVVHKALQSIKHVPCKSTRQRGVEEHSVEILEGHADTIYYTHTYALSRCL